MMLIIARVKYSLLVVFSLIFLASCEDEYKERAKEQREVDEKIIQEYITQKSIQNAQRLSSGLYYIPQVAGTGVQVKKNDVLTTHYISKELTYGTTIASTYEGGQPQTFKIGQTTGILGLDEGLALLKEGEKATLIIPSGLAYGISGNYTTVGPNTILIYEINVLKVN